MVFKKVLLKDIAEVIMGSSPRSEFYSESEGVPFLQGTRTFGRMYPKIDTYTKKVTRMAKKNDILFSVRAPVGNINFAPTDLCIGRGLSCIKPISVDKKFLYYLLIGNIRMYESKSTGTIFSSINKKELESLEFEIPNIKVQKKIGSFLWFLDSKIELNNSIISNLEEFSQTLFKRWFVDFEFPNEEGKPYKSSGGKMVESELGMIPEGWEIQKIEQQSKIVRGGSPRPIKDYVQDTGIPWVKISDANASRTMYLQQTNEFIKEEGKSKSREVFPGTLILSNSATPGIPMIMNIYACVHDGWLIFDEFEDISKEYMYQFLKYERKNILTLSNGSVFRNLKTSILKKYPIIVPESNVLKDFQKIIENIQSKILNIDLECIKLESLRDTLLPKLLSGEIELSDEEEVKELV